MLLIWTVAWSIFAANPLAAYMAEQHVARTSVQQADIDARILSSQAAVRALKSARAV